MALTVEDGTGLESAESYISVAELTAYWSARGVTLSDGDTALENACRKAFDYLNSKWRFKGARLTADQAGEFPRSDLLDWSYFAVEGIPKRLKNAACELASRALTEDLSPDNDKTGTIKSESVGPISVTYGGDGAVQDKEYSAAFNQIRQYVRSPDSPPIPHAPTERDPLFTLGMDENPNAPQRGDDATDLTE